MIGGFGQSVNPNNSISAPVNQTVTGGNTLVVSVATGTFSGDVGCHDDAGNHYDKIADKNTGNGRLFVCVGQIVSPLASGENVTGTYPGFSGVSAISVVQYDGEYTAVDHSTGAGSNPPVNSGSICVNGGHELFGVVANTNVSTFAVDTPPWFQLLPTQSGGGGASKRTLSPSVKPFSGGPCSPEALTGHLTGSGFWQAAIIAVREVT